MSSDKSRPSISRIGRRTIPQPAITVDETLAGIQFIKHFDGPVSAVIHLRRLAQQSISSPLGISESTIPVPPHDVPALLALFASEREGDDEIDFWTARSARIDEYLAKREADMEAQEREEAERHAREERERQQKDPTEQEGVGGGATPPTEEP